MKIDTRFCLAILTSGLLLVLAEATAGPVLQAPTTHPSTVRPGTISGLQLKVDCFAEFGKFTANQVSSFGGVIIDNAAYGTFGTPDSGPSTPTFVALLNGHLHGTIVVALPGTAPHDPNITQPPHTVLVDIHPELDHTLTMHWEFETLKFNAPVSSCAGHLWAASAGKSAIMLRVGS
jgi:hypothetical protein